MNSGILRAGKGQSVWVVGDLSTSPESGAFRPQDTEKLLAVAPKYGIEIRLPPS